MHIKDFCLCPECISRLAVQHDEMETQAKAFIASLSRKRRNARIVACSEPVKRSD